jgi:protein subunit release factor A
MTLYSLGTFIDGDMDEMTDALITAERAEILVNNT